MARRILLTCSVVLALAVAAHANGRPPASETIHFRQGHPADIVVGLTFGVIISHDGGATWEWMCEAAVGYAGLYDPVYLYSASGAIFATTFNGFVVNRTGCTFDATSLGLRQATAAALGSGGELYVAMSDNSATTPDSKIYRSTDDGVTFDAGVLPPSAVIGDWMETLVTAPSDARRVYVSYYGSRPSGSSMVRTFFLASSTDGAATFSALPVTAFAPVASDSVIDLVGVSPTDPGVVYARVAFENNSLQTSLYRSADAGKSWTKVVCGAVPCAAGADGVKDSLTTGIDSKGNVYVGSSASGAWTSTDGGVTFTHTTAGAKSLQCLGVDANDQIWGCGDNYGKDLMGLGKTTDFATWTTVLRFQNIAQPVACPASTSQHDTCQAMTWCGLEQQLMITSTAVPCPADAGVGVDAPHPVTTSKGCCDTGAQPGSLAVAAMVAMLLWRPRRR